MRDEGFVVGERVFAFCSRFFLYEARLTQPRPSCRIPPPRPECACRAVPLWLLLSVHLAGTQADDGLVLTLAYDNKMRVYDEKTAQLKTVLDNPHECLFADVALVPSHSQVPLLVAFTNSGWSPLPWLRGETKQAAVALVYLYLLVSVCICVCVCVCIALVPIQKCWLRTLSRSVGFAVRLVHTRSAHERASVVGRVLTREEIE